MYVCMYVFITNEILESWVTHTYIHILKGHTYINTYIHTINQYKHSINLKRDVR